MTLARGQSADTPHGARASDGAQPAGPSVAVMLAAVAGTGYLLLAGLVATDVLQPLDAAARELFRPHDVWGPTQLRADVVVEGFKPRNTAVLLGLVAVVVSLWRRSWRPLLYTAGISVLTAALTLLTKILLRRPDTHDVVTQTGGSFPSGHTVTLLVACGAVLLMVRSSTRWWHWTPVALATATMSLSLLVQAAHWLTDVVGGTLLGVVVLSIASLWSLRR